MRSSPFLAVFKWTVLTVISTASFHWRILWVSFDGLAHQPPAPTGGCPLGGDSRQDPFSPTSTPCGLNLGAKEGNGQRHELRSGIRSPRAQDSQVPSPHSRLADHTRGRSDIGVCTAPGDVRSGCEHHGPMRCRANPRCVRAENLRQHASCTQTRVRESMQKVPIAAAISPGNADGGPDGKRAG